jgi:hypothetical protein
MRITTGKVVSGKVVLDDEGLPDGTTVTIIAAEDSEEFELGAADEADLLESIQQGSKGLTIPADEVISKLKSQR